MYALRFVHTPVFVIEFAHCHQDTTKRDPLIRVHIFEKGQGASPMSIYCYKHGCSKIISLRDAPSHRKIMQWAQQGALLGADKSLRKSHMDAWMETMRAAWCSEDSHFRTCFTCCIGTFCFSVLKWSSWQANVQSQRHVSNLQTA